MAMWLWAFGLGIWAHRPKMGPRPQVKIVHKRSKSRDDETWLDNMNIDRLIVAS